MTVTKTALHLHSEFKWWQIDNAVDIDENTKQVLTYDKYDMCKATLTTDGENMPAVSDGQWWSVLVLSMFVVGQVLSV